MKNERIEHLLDELSSGLKADPEIHLDVKSELRAHLNDKISEYEHAGLAETESTEQALKSFGDIVIIADGLVEANTPRMKLKARLWRFVAILLIPAVVICALVSFYPVLSNISIVNEGLTAVSHKGMLFTTHSWLKKSLKLLDKSYSTEENLILHGDTTQKYNWQQQKALCDKFPDNKVYWANYILHLINERKNKELTKAKIFAELKYAQAIDPDNAFYNYITAGLMLEDACSYKTKSRGYGEKRSNRVNEIVDFKVKNRQLLDQAMDEYLAGTRKKYCRSYTKQLVQQRLKIMGEPTNLATSIQQMLISASTILPHISFYRKTTRIISKYNQLLVKEKKEQAALVWMQSWQPYLQHQLEDSDYLINTLVIIASAKELKHSLPSLYRKLGKKRQATVTELQLQRIVNVKNNWEQTKKLHNADKILKKAGALSSILLPVFGIQFSEQELAVSRRIDYINIEKFIIAFLNILFIGGMLLAITVMFSWRWRTGTKAILLTPTIKTIGKILLWGIIIPIAGYLLISSLGIIGGHGYSIIYNSALYFQILLLLIFIPGIIFYLTKKQVILRCQQLEIALPEQTKMSKARIIILSSIIIILGIAALIPMDAKFGETILKFIFLTTIVLTLIFIFLIVINFAAKFIIVFWQRQYAIYYGALAKSLLPILALAVVFLTLICIPYLNYQEALLIKQDKVIFGSPEKFTPAEGMAVANLNAQLEHALKVK